MNETRLHQALACISIARDIIINENDKNVNHTEIIDNLNRAAVTTASLAVHKDDDITSVNSLLSTYGMDDLKFDKDTEKDS